MEAFKNMCVYTLSSITLPSEVDYNIAWLALTCSSSNSLTVIKLAILNQPLIIKMNSE